jgi:hypothetical protein
MELLNSYGQSLSEHYDKLKNESDKIKNFHCDKLNQKSCFMINYILFNFDLNILKIDKKDYDTCFEIRNDLILTLSKLLE